MRRLLAGLLAAATVLAPAMTPADDHRPPDAVLRVESQDLQDGINYHYCWAVVGESYTTVSCAVGIYRFPEAVEVPFDVDVGLVFKSHTRPTQLQVFAWALAGPDGYPIGPPELMPVTLVEEADGWQARFETLVPCRHYYLDVYGVWPDVDDPSVEQDSNWTFHFVTGAPAPLPPDQDCALSLPEA